MIRIHFAWLTAALLTVLPFAAGAQQSATAASANVLTGGKVTSVPFRAGTILSAEITKEHTTLSQFSSV